MVARFRWSFHELGAWHFIRLERVRGSARETIWLEAGRHFHGIYDRGCGVCTQLCGSWAHPGQIRTPVLFAGGRHPGEPGFLPLLVHDQPSVFVYLLRRDRRFGQRLWLFHTDPGYGEMVSGQAGFGRGTGRRRLWGGLGDLRTLGTIEINSGLRASRYFPDFGRCLSGNDRGWRSPVKEPAAGLQASWIDI